MEIRKKPTFLWVINNSIIYKFFKDFTNDRKTTNRAVVFSSRPFSNILKHKDHRETFQQSGKQDPFRHILNSSASMYESSGSLFFRTTTGTQAAKTPLMNQDLL